jgi:hypothetical protein
VRLVRWLFFTSRTDFVDNLQHPYVGSIPEIDEIFPPRPPPLKRVPPEDPQAKAVPVATGAGFFTPDTGYAGNLFRAWKPDMGQPQPFRMDPPQGGPRDSMYFCPSLKSSEISHYPEQSF